MQQHNIKLVLSQDRLKKLARSLRLGDILKGKVLKELSDDRYLIDFQGEEMTATFMGKLRPGSTIRTVVQGLSPVIVLKFF